jgi:hypothetical protein
MIHFYTRIKLWFIDITNYSDCMRQALGYACRNRICLGKKEH